MMKGAIVGAAVALALASCTVGAPPRAVGRPALIVEGDPWRVIAVNGRATPTGDYFVQFERANFSAKFGCNNMGGTYGVDVNGRLLVGQIAQTLIGCPEPSLSFEAEGARVVQAPMQTLGNGDQVTLSSSGGTITLSRPYRP